MLQPLQSYGYDADDNVTGVVDFVSATNNQQITYDNLDRITFASSGAYTLISSITYDSNSNRKSYSGTGYTVAATSNQITKVGGSTNLTYTSAGNMNAFGASQAMTYNQANKMATATAFGASNTYTYDAFGRRVLVKPGSNPLFVQSYDQGYNMLEETSNNTVNDYVYVDNFPVAVIKTATPTTSYIHTDRIGFPQKATSAAQAIVYTGTPNPFGSVTPTTSVTMNVRGQGQYADSTPYYYNNARYAYPGLNVFPQTDPIGLAGGMNTYIIGLQNPLKDLDPSGLQEQAIPIMLCARFPTLCLGTILTIADKFHPMSTPHNDDHNTNSAPSQPAAPGRAIPKTAAPTENCSTSAVDDVEKPENPKPDDKMNQCITECYKILERPKRFPGDDSNTWDFQKCINNCMGH